MTERKSEHHRTRGRHLLRVAVLLLSFTAAAATVGDTLNETPLDESVRQLRAQLRTVVESYGRRSARYGVFALSLETGDTLYDKGARDLLAPASNLKLLTTAAALQYLGPDFRSQTFLLADGPIDKGCLKGDLVLYGTGDPGFSGRFMGVDLLEALADSLQDAGVYVVEGDVVGDGTFFSGPLLGEGWDPDDLNDAFAAPSSSLSFDENVVTLRVVPSVRGKRPTIHTIPDGANLPIEVTALTGGRGGRVRVSREDPSQSISVYGSLSPTGRDVWRRITVFDPPRFTASVFRSVLEKRGIHVTGDVRTIADVASSPVTARSLWAPALDTKRKGPRIIAAHQSPPLLEYLKIVNKKSHNLFADLTLKTIGRMVTGEGSFAAGSEVVRRFLADEVKTDTVGVIIHDGSGLSELSRVSPAVFVDVIKHMAQTSLWNLYWETLPEAGNPRELRRMYRTPAAGNLRAKTGTIKNVSSLSGMVRSANGERILFSILANDVSSTGGAKRIEDRIGIRLASFERPFTISAPGIAIPPTPLPAPVTVSTHTVRPGENLTVIARRYGITLGALTAANPRLSPRRLMPGTELLLPSAALVDVQTHRVRAGENFSVIARTYGVSLNGLITANPNLDPRRLQIGQRVRIPAGAG
ncbi:MAG TPA: D-alanyl-D-alanine carboxypeptidase/D-alanyl-D-alanine-endopeptidase [Gemmatimonadetes bacterium]|nr:D-alanyl-D-alanine carboxypeptidase/D-alanyl-D-alanine-endopeptidase [Gemmatimonadota bacterium]